jgi:hypothetical protein
MLSYAFEDGASHLILPRPSLDPSRAYQSAWEHRKECAIKNGGTEVSDWKYGKYGPVEPGLRAEIQQRYLTPEGERNVRVMDELRNSIPKMTLEDREMWERVYKRNMLPPIAPYMLVSPDMHYYLVRRDEVLQF